MLDTATTVLMPFNPLSCVRLICTVSPTARSCALAVVTVAVPVSTLMLSMSSGLSLIGMAKYIRCPSFLMSAPLA